MVSQYIRYQIVKHALEYYIKRPNADPADIAREKNILEYYREMVEWQKEKNHIK